MIAQKAKELWDFIRAEECKAKSDRHPRLADFKKRQRVLTRWVTELHNS